jgi:hypothetical protein
MSQLTDLGFRCLNCGKSIVWDRGRLVPDGDFVSNWQRNKPIDDLECPNCHREFNYQHEQMVNLPPNYATHF